MAAGILYVLVYRTDDYKRLKVTVEKQSKKCKPYTIIDSYSALTKKISLLSTGFTAYRT